MNYHCYADDTQVYLVIEPRKSWTDTLHRIEACLADISDWMRSNPLKLNQDKTELIVFAPKQRVNDFTNCKLAFDGTVVSDVACVKNMGYTLTSHLLWKSKLVLFRNHVFIR